jgi:hypothetical protein
MIKLLSHIDLQPLNDEYCQLEKDIQWTDYGHKGRQVGLQFKVGEDPWTSAVGRSNGQELSYTNLNPFFQNTKFEALINQYNLKRTRLIWVGPYACYSMHQDETPRIHVPLITNPECYFVFHSGELSNLTTNNVWWVDTRLRHTFMNCSDSPRLHLVGIVET